MLDVSMADLVSVLRDCGSVCAAADHLGISRSALRSRLGDYKAREILDDSRDREIVESNVRLAKQKQGQMDTNRIERKSFREHARIENACEAYNGAIVEALKGHKWKPVRGAKRISGERHAILHWSDHHLNERIQLGKYNTYDWTVAAQRLRKHVQECLRTCEGFGIGHVFVGFTGDLINSDRRLDEMLGNAGNRAKATVLAVDVYRQALGELASHLDVTTGCVTGNEGRANQELGWNAHVATDNYDFTIYEMLRLLMDDSPINFLYNEDPGELLVNIGGQNCLFIHGHGGVKNKGDTQSSVQSIKGRYNARGISVDLVFWGHIHESYISDAYARSASLCGTNDYNEKALNLSSRAAQNMYLVLEEGGFHGIKFDLQDAGHIEPYNITERLEAYDAKAARLLHTPTVIHQVVI